MTAPATHESVRAQVERELPTPAAGFATEQAAVAHRKARERRFKELWRASLPEIPEEQVW